MTKTDSYLSLIDSVFNKLTGMTFPNFVQSTFTNATTVINNAITLGNIPKYTQGSCGNVKKSNSQNLIDKIINFQLKSNKPITLNMSSFHSMEIGGERSFRNAVDIVSGGYIGVYLNPGFYPTNSGTDNCCSEKYGRWLQTTFGPVVETDYLDDLSNFLHIYGAPFYSIYPSGPFAGVGLLGNTGAIRGDSPPDCKPVPINDGNKLSQNQIDIEETTIYIKLYNNTNALGSYSLMDVLGTLITKGDLSKKCTTQINKSTLVPGIYILNTSVGQNIKSYKITII